MSAVYEPSRRLRDKISRRLTPFRAQKLRRVALERPLISFTFDDCPKSAIDAGLPLLEAQGWRSTVYVACGLWDQTNHLGLHMSADDTQAVAAAGHEIGDHTFSHIDGRATPPAAFLADIGKNQAALDAINIAPSTTFAYPYGEVTPVLKRNLQARFKAARGIQNRHHTSIVDLNQIGSYPLFNSGRFDHLLYAMRAMETQPAWLTIFTHDVCDNPSPWGCTPGQLETLIAAARAMNAQVLPITEAVDVLSRANRLETTA